MFVNPANMLKEAIEFECPICCELFDEDTRFPLMICPAQHTCCAHCHAHIIFGGKGSSDTADCPFCKCAIQKEQAVKFRLLNEIRIATSRLKIRGSEMRVEMENLQEGREEVEDKLKKEKEKNEWLINQLANFNKSINYWRERCTQLEKELAEFKGKSTSRIPGSQSSLEEVPKLISQPSPPPPPSPPPAVSPIQVPSPPPFHIPVPHPPKPNQNIFRQFDNRALNLNRPSNQQSSKQGNKSVDYEPPRGIKAPSPRQPNKDRSFHHSPAEGRKKSREVKEERSDSYFDKLLNNHARPEVARNSSEKVMSFQHRPGLAVNKKYSTNNSNSFGRTG